MQINLMCLQCFTFDSVEKQKRYIAFEKNNFSSKNLNNVSASLKSALIT